MQSEAAVLGKPSLWREASRILNEEGFRAFWKGNLVTVAHRLPYSALNFYAYEKYNKVSCFLVFFELYPLLLEAIDDSVAKLSFEYVRYSI